MCELFGVSSARRVGVNSYLSEFVSHSVNHPNGWGMAVFYGDAVSLEKEPVSAWTSSYLQSRLKHPFEVQNMIAHIRLATRGGMAYENSHPFVHRDESGRAWTLAHNGTIFQSELLDHYKATQEGSTDSERILCHIIHEADRFFRAYHRDMTPYERFRMVDQAVLKMADHNKLNLLLYDGELLYVHTNMQHTLYYKKQNQSTIFATVPLDEEEWKPVPFMQTLAFQDGELLFEGTKHQYEYVELKGHRQIFDYAGL